MIVVESNKGSATYMAIAILSDGEWEAYKEWRLEGQTLLEEDADSFTLLFRGKHYRYRYRPLLLDPHSQVK